MSDSTPTINSDTAQPAPFFSARGVSVPADGMCIIGGTESDNETPASAIVILKSGPVQLTRTLNSEEARIIGKELIQIADEIEAVAQKAAADALAKMTGGGA